MCREYAQDSRARSHQPGDRIAAAIKASMEIPPTVAVAVPACAASCGDTGAGCGSEGTLNCGADGGAGAPTGEGSGIVGPDDGPQSDGNMTCSPALT